MAGTEEHYELPASGLFPATQRDWLVQQVEGGDPGRKNANGLVMELYGPALEAYFRGSSFRTMGDAPDLVAGFFASRLDRVDFFARWLESGIPLRRWLMNGFVFFLQEEKRKRRGRGDEAEDDSAPEQLAIEDFERAWMREVVRRACDRAGEVCAECGQSLHWTLFLRHHVHGVDYVTLAKETGVARTRAPGMVRTAADVLRRAVLEILVREGVPAKDLDEETRRLMASTGGG